MFQGSTNLKYYKRLGIYKNSTGTVTFDPKTNIAYSYNWRFVAPVKGKIVFNDYKWSNTTSGHQSAVRSVLRELNIPYICGDFFDYSADNINPKYVYQKLCETELSFEVTRKGTFKSNWIARDMQNQIANLEKLKTIGLKVSLKDQKAIRQSVFDRYHSELNETLFLKNCKHLDKIAAETVLADPIF